MARLTDVVNDPRDEWSVAEKRRAVKTVDELVKVAKSYARIARPQVRAYVSILKLCNMLTVIDRYALAFN